MLALSRPVHGFESRTRCVAKISEHAQRVITAQRTGKDYIDIALRIRERKDVPEDLQKNKGLGKWAVKLLNRTVAKS
jgi:hypothetical protein